MKATEVPRDPDCGQQHLGRCGGLSFAERIRSMRIDSEGLPSRSASHRERGTFYDDDAIADQFGGKRAPERREELFEETKGLGAGQRGKDGKLYVRDPKTKEQRRMTPKDVKDVYLGGPIVDET